MTIEERLNFLGYRLPVKPEPAANYIGSQVSGKLAFFAGTGPDDQWPLFGKVGKDLTVEQGRASAENAALNLISKMKGELGDLNRITKIVYLIGLVNSEPDFEKQPEVIDGASDVFVNVFGERGRHARAAFSTASLPWNIPIELIMVAEIK